MKDSKLNIVTIITTVIFILASFFVFYCKQHPEIYITKLPVIISMFVVTMLIYPFVIYKIIKNEYQKNEAITRIISKVLLIITGNFILVLLFTTMKLTIEIASILSILNCLLVFFLLFNKDFKIKSVLVEHWIITTVFIGLIYFIR